MENKTRYVCFMGAYGLEYFNVKFKDIYVNTSELAAGYESS